MNEFINNETVNAYKERAQALKEQNKRFSDVEDEAGNQYVDLVQEGGGVLGVALVGYTYILESVGIRFFSLAGTSAGAINTMLIAALSNIGDPISEKILKITSEKNLFDLVDGDKAVKKLIQKAIKKEKGMGWFLIWNGIKIFKIIKRQLGLNPGNDFELWITAELAKAGVSSLNELNEKRKQLPKGLKHIASDSSFEAKLAIITSDITTHTKAEFPKMAGLYWENPGEVPPAKLVRASMSIPIFFEPFKVEGLPDAGQKEHPKWDEYASYLGEVPQTVRFVDGGMLSNFPINVFHREDNKPPSMPTFGVRLSTYREEYSKTDGLAGLSGAMISTMRQIHDYDFLMKNPDYRKLICRIDADQQFNWLDFNMSREEQIKLFNLGAGKAIEFLEEFDWEGYKKIRSGLALS